MTKGLEGFGILVLVWPCYQKIQASHNSSESILQMPQGGSKVLLPHLQVPCQKWHNSEAELGTRPICPEL